jgi:hypothetical protein
MSFNKKEYMKEYNKNYRKRYRDNPDNIIKIAEAGKKYREENAEAIKQRRIESRKKNREKILLQKRAWYQRNKKKILQSQKDKKYWRRYKKLQHNAHILAYFDATREERMRKAIERSQKNYRKSPNGKVAVKLRRALLHYVKNKTKSSIKLLGCTIEKACDSLESKFKEGMTWENMGRGGWHIDHIIPCAFFDLTKPSHQKVCFNWQNLQPLWESENCSKSNKIHWSIVLTILINNYKTIEV